MVQVLPYVPSFLEQLTPYLNQAASDIASGLEQRSALKALQPFLNPQQMQGGTPGANEPNAQPNQAGNASASNQPVDILNNLSPADLPKFYATLEKATGNPKAARAVYDWLLQNREMAQKQALQERKFERQQAMKAEPELLERENKLNHYEQEAMRFERLQHLFSPELESKFPSSISVGLFTKDGELRPTAAAALSPEAQESVKLISDNLLGAKDTFGARVTNFDLQSYMKRLPTLLNSAEGRRRVLRDLRLINKLNTMHEQGVLDIIEKRGGPEKISLSKAERIYKKENAKEIDQIKKEFVNPEKNVFSDKPDPQIYYDQILVDEDTGERLKSNGKEWIPEQ